jgi:hypothetical protein
MNEKITATRQECMKFSQEENFRTYVNHIYISVFCFYSSFLFCRKDEIERLRRDLGQTPRSVVAPQAAKPVAQQDIDYVCIDLFYKIDFYFYIMFLSIEKIKR